MEGTVEFLKIPFHWRNFHGLFIYLNNILEFTQLIKQYVFSNIIFTTSKSQFATFQCTNPQTGSRKRLNVSDGWFGLSVEKIGKHYKAPKQNIKRQSEWLASQRD